MLPIWEERPISVAHLLNPAFCGEIMRRCAFAYQQKHPNKERLPFQLAFLILPLVLHKEIREHLPNTSAKNFMSWVTENQAIKMELPQLIRLMLPYTKESIMFLMIYKVIKINEFGAIEVLIKSPTKIQEDEVAICFNKAALVGSWLAKAGSSHSIFTSLGIRP
jgi:Family of unknown function (DUF6521)